MKPKIQQLELAAARQVSPPPSLHAQATAQATGSLDHLDQQIVQFNARIEELMIPFVDEEAVAGEAGCDSGVKTVITIQNVTAEIGTQMNLSFPAMPISARVAGMCPGNEPTRPANESGARPPKATAGRDALPHPSGLAAGPHAPTTAIFGSQYASPCRPKGQKASLLLAVGLHVARDHLPYHQVPRRDYQDFRLRLLPRLRTLML